MACTTCPKCGFDLQSVDRIDQGHLLIEGNAAVYWRGRRLKLNVQERLYLIALVRAAGAMVADHVAAEVFGYEGDDPNNMASVLLCRMRARFREVDPTFDSLERTGEAGYARGTRWRSEAYMIQELASASTSQRALHKLMLEKPGKTIVEYAAMRDGRHHSSTYCVLKSLERKRLVKRERRYQRGWTAIGTLAMHADLAAAK